MFPAQGHRRDAVASAARTAAAVLLLLVAYYQAPLDRPLTVTTGLLFAVSLLLLALALVVQVRAILVSATPALRAVRTLAMGVPMLLVVFASTYVIIDGQQSDAFSEPLSRTDGLYFTVTTFATVGYGDITPVTQLARVTVTVQMVIGLVAVGLIAKVVVGAVQLARERNSASHSLADR